MGKNQQRTERTYWCVIEALSICSNRTIYLKLHESLFCFIIVRASHAKNFFKAFLRKEVFDKDSV